MPELFGQDRELGELYDALLKEEQRELRRTRDLAYSSQIDQGYFNDQGQQNAEFDELMRMRQASGMGGAAGSVPQEILQELVSDMKPRKRLTQEQIHNYGVMYGSPLTQQQIDYFEDQLNRNPNESYMGSPPQYPR